MRVLVLCKRQYTGKDLLDDRYGRLFELPAGLVQRGHEVAGLACSYRRRGVSYRIDEGVQWWSVDAMPAPFAYWRKLLEIATDFRPDVIWASSDAFHAVLAAHLRKKLGLPVVIDLYDDYESFGLTALPGLRRLFRHACTQADALSAISQTLVTTLRTRLSHVPPLEVIGNGVPQMFSRKARDEARSYLGLPLHAQLLGTAGALDGSRGIDDLIRAFALLRARLPDIHLVVAGPRDRTFANALGERVIDLGVLPHSDMPWLYSALDVGVVCNRDSAFGRACCPQKLVEMIACRLPVVVAELGDAATWLHSYQGSLYPPGDSVMLAQRLEAQLAVASPVPATLAPEWSTLSGALESLLQKAIDGYRSSHASQA
jgi:glycosyltransferase involved in cell wall biosynthesis